MWELKLAEWKAAVLVGMTVGKMDEMENSTVDKRACPWDLSD